MLIDQVFHIRTFLLSLSCYVWMVAVWAVTVELSLVSTPGTRLNPWSPHSWPQQVGEAATDNRQHKRQPWQTTQGRMTSSSLPPEPLPCLTPVVRGAPSISPKLVFWQGQYVTLPQLYAVSCQRNV